MYYYVEDKQFLKSAQTECAEMLNDLVVKLRSKGINSQFF